MSPRCISITRKTQSKHRKGWLLPVRTATTNKKRKVPQWAGAQRLQPCGWEWKTTWPPRTSLAAVHGVTMWQPILGVHPKSKASTWGSWQLDSRWLRGGNQWMSIKRWMGKQRRCTPRRDLVCCPKQGRGMLCNVAEPWKHCLAM